MVTIRKSIAFMTIALMLAALFGYAGISLAASTTAPTPYCGPVYDSEGNPVGEIPCPSAEPGTKPPPVIDGELAVCPDVVTASQLIAHNDNALVREGGRNPGEEPCLFEWRNDPLAPSSTVWCVEGWALELDTVGPNGYYYFCGPEDFERNFEIDAGSFRLIAAYPDGDPIHDPCAALANSRNFLEFSGAPKSFQLLPGNFTCDGEVTPVEPGNGDDGTANVCPPADRPGRVASLVGGRAGEWHWLADLAVWKRLTSRAADLVAPWGTLDWWDGRKAHYGTEKANDAFEATWNC